MDQELTSRRRVAFALLVGLVIQAVSLGAIGFVAAGDPAAEIPDTFGVPERQAGDSGIYTLSVVRETVNGTEVVWQPREAIHFRLDPPTETYDRDGTSHVVNRLHWGERISNVRNPIEDDPLHANWTSYHRPDRSIYSKANATYHLDAGTGELISLTSQGVGGRTEPGSVESTDVRWNRTWTELPREGERDSFSRALPCGLVHRMQGQDVALNGSVDLFPPCEFLHDASGRNPYEAVDVQRLDGQRCVVLQRTRPVSAVRELVWMCEGVPYPVRQVLAWEDLEGVYTVLELADFQRGSTPLADQATPVERPDAPEPDWDDREPWGLDDSGVDHPFPLSEAYRRARDSATWSDFRDWLQDHPDAFTQSAYYWQDHVVAPAWYRTGTERQWTFHVTDGEDGIAIRAVQKPAADQGSRNGTETLLDTTYDYEFERLDTEEMGWAQNIPPDRIPREAPTVASLVDTWEAYASSEYADHGANTWAFRYRDWSETMSDCPVRDLQADPDACVFFSFRIGYQHHESQTVHDERAPVYHRNHTRSLLYFDIYREPWGLLEGRTLVEDRVSDPFGGPADEEPDDVDVAGAPTRVWVFPADYAAAIGLLGVIATVLYWAWPVLKHGGLTALYTRIRRPEALDHPVRQAMVELVRDEPGIHLQEIVRRLDLGKGAARHHLKKLVELDLLSRHDSQGYACYFPAGAIDRRVMAAAPALRSGSARRVLEAIVDQPGLSNGEVAARTGLSPSTVSHHLARLQEVELVRADSDGRSLSLVPTEVADQAVDELGL